MRRNITDQSCKLYHTAYCDLLNMPSCAECMVNSTEDGADQAMKDLDVLMSLLPEGGLHHLFSGEECVLCKGKPNKRECYGLLDLAHPEPQRSKRSIIGLKVKSSVGSLVPVQIGACNACKKRILRLEYLPVTLPLYLGILTLIALTLPGVSDALERISAILPFAIFIGIVLVAAVAGRLLASALHNRYDKLTHLDPFELPTLREMKDKGWFPLNTNGKRLRMIFVKKRMRMGVCTGTPKEATAGQP